MADSTDSSIRVLIVDDFAETRENIRKLLQFESDIAVVGAARSGEEAIEMAKETKPDVILMDINMSDMDGITATEAILREVPFTQIVILSVQSEPDYMRRAMLAGARDFMVKPPSSDELIGTIRNVAVLAQDQRKKVETPVRQLAAQNRQAERGIADGAGHEHRIAGTRATATEHPPGRYVAERHDRNRHRAGRRIRVAADQMHAVFVLIFGEAAGEGGNPLLGDGLWQHDVEHVGARDGALRGKVRQICAQRLAGDEVRRIVVQEMHAADERVGFGNQLMARWRRDHRRVIEQPKGAREPSCERCEVTRDELELAGEIRGLCHRIHLQDVMKRMP